jgi:hypothetical protein
VDKREGPVEGHRVGRRSSLGDVPRRGSVTKSIVKVSCEAACFDAKRKLPPPKPVLAWVGFEADMHPTPIVEQCLSHEGRQPTHTGAQWFLRSAHL